MDIDINKVRAVVFDLDGTLYNNKKFPIRLVLSSLKSTFAFNAERKVRRQMKGVDLENATSFYNSFFSHIADKTKMNPQKTQEWYWDTYMDSFIRILHNSYTPNVNVAKIFQHLADHNIQTAIYSDYPLVKERIEALGLPEDLCENYWSAPDMGALKPAIRPMHEIASALGIDTDEILVVGDRVDTDGKSAFSCNAQFIHILKNETKEEHENGFVSMHWNEFSHWILNI